MPVFCLPIIFSALCTTVVKTFVVVVGGRVVCSFGCGISVGKLRIKKKKCQKKNVFKLKYVLYENSLD